MNILLTGGAGYIANHTAIVLEQARHDGLSSKSAQNYFWLTLIWTNP